MNPQDLMESIPVYREEITGALKNLVSSLATGEVTEHWRVANIFPLFKGIVQ